jgi:hydrogenase-4 component E
MPVTIYEVVGMMAAVVAILMLGSNYLRFNLWMYCLQTWLISAATAIFAWNYHSNSFYWIAGLLFLERAIVVPFFLNSIAKKIDVERDPGIILPAPLAMHVSMLLFGLSYFVSRQLPPISPGGVVIATATAGISLLFSGLLMMLTRRFALSQIVGFITLENGLYLFALTQTEGLPFMIEMGVFLDILGAVMIAGVLVFSIKRSFEHIDVTYLKHLKH